MKNAFIMSVLLLAGCGSKDKEPQPEVSTITQKQPASPSPVDTPVVEPVRAAKNGVALRLVLRPGDKMNRSLEGLVESKSAAGMPSQTSRLKMTYLTEVESVDKGLAT